MSAFGPKRTLLHQFTNLAATKAATLRCAWLMLFFFNLAGAVHDPDEVGVELASLGIARETAVRFAAEYIRDRPEVVWLGDELRVEVTDSKKLILFTLIVVGVDAPAGKGKT